MLKHFTCSQEVGKPSQNYVGKTHYFGIPTRLVLVGGSFNSHPLNGWFGLAKDCDVTIIGKGVRHSDFKQK